MYICLYLLPLNTDTSYMVKILKGTFQIAVISLSLFATSFIFCLHTVLLVHGALKRQYIWHCHQSLLLKNIPLISHHERKWLWCIICDMICLYVKNKVETLIPHTSKIWMISTFINLHIYVSIITIHGIPCDVFLSFGIFFAFSFLVYMKKVWLNRQLSSVTGSFTFCAL